MSDHREVQLAIRALIEAALPHADVLGFEKIVPETIAAAGGGTVIGHPFDAGEPEIDLSPPTWNFTTRFPIELKPRAGSADLAADIDALRGPIAAAVRANRTLGGLVEWLEATAFDEDDDTPTAGAAQRSAGFDLIAHYSTTDPLG